MFARSPISHQKERSRLLARIDGLHEHGDWKANGTSDIASDKRNVNGRTGYTSRIEQCVCAWGGLTIDYEAHDIGRQIRTTRRGTEGSGSARRRRAEGALAQPLWHAATSEDSSLSPDRGGCSPTAGECTGRTQTFAPPPSNAGCQRPGNSPTLPA